MIAQSFTKHQVTVQRLVLYIFFMLVIQNSRKVFQLLYLGLNSIIRCQEIMHWLNNTLVYYCISALMHWCICIFVHKFIVTLMHWFINTLKHKEIISYHGNIIAHSIAVVNGCIAALVYYCIGALIDWCISALVH